jgi:hypothetical protein
MILYRNAKLTIACDNCYATMKTLTDEERAGLEQIKQPDFGTEFCDETCASAYRKPERRKLQTA